MKNFLLTFAVAISSYSIAYADVAEDIKSNIQKNYPATTVTQVNKTPLTGIYEVVMGRNVAYTDKDGRYFIFGNLFDMKTQTDLTTTPTSSNKVEVGFPNADRLKDAIKTVKGNGKRKLVVFSDPDCPYCQQLERNLQSIDNVTIYTFLYPLESIHPTAKTTAVSIWCSKNPGKAFQDYMIENIKPSSKNCAHPIDRNIEFASSMNIQGTPSLIFEDGSMVPGAVGVSKLERLINSSQK